MTNRLVVLVVAVMMLAAVGCRHGAPCATCGPNPFAAPAVTAPGTVLPYSTPPGAVVGAPPANGVPYTQ